MKNAYDIPTIWALAYDAVQSESPQQTLDWFANIPHPSEITDSLFLSELAWCVYNAGMKEQVVRAKWPDIESIYSYFDADSILLTEHDIPHMMRNIFNHQGKVNAVLVAAKKVKKDGPMNVKLSRLSESEALVYLQEFPFIGKITCYHLARNIGFDVVKPDRHLVRLAEYFHTTPDDLVDDIASFTKYRRGFIDFVLWQWMAWVGAKVIRETSVN